MSEPSAAMNLAANLTHLRRTKNFSQRKLAEAAGIPRSTLTHIESGDGNPSLANLTRLATALGVGIEELLARPRGEHQLMRAADVPRVEKGRGGVTVLKLLPERIRGLEMDRMEIEAGAMMKGTPHVVGTKEYLHVITGVITVRVAGERIEVGPGDVFAFPGDQGHAYQNHGRGKAVGISVVVPLPAG